MQEAVWWQVELGTRRPLSEYRPEALDARLRAARSAPQATTMVSAEYDSSHPARVTLTALMRLPVSSVSSRET